MNNLSPTDFSSWFSQLWGYDPFPWQQELVEQVHQEQCWPELVDLPTGTGKTSLIDIAIFLQALDASRPPTERWMPRRIVCVVDRRVVVDQAAQRAQYIAGAHVGPEPGTTLSKVASRLLSLAGRTSDDDVDPPVLVATLRGAIAKDESWLRRPDVPAIISSTIDQVGSRLLFRGYGVSRSMRPVHAGLLGNDVLWLLDEVHLARPFAETLQQLGRHRHPGFDRSGLPNRWVVVEMSATPTVETSKRFPAVPLDGESHPIIARRLSARKPVTRAAVKVPTDSLRADEKFATECAKRAQKLITAGARTIGVIVNRVDTARLVHQKLVTAGTPSHLLTGRMRPIDRDDFWAAHRSRIESGRSRVDTDPEFVLVSTQCIEAGADLDLDAIVTEAAAFDALIQRFGRVDRLGNLSAAGKPCTSVILARSVTLKGDYIDPVYGSAIKATWDLLESEDVTDFGIGRLQDVSADPANQVIQASPLAPVLLATQLDQLSQTSAPVSAEPEVSRWLHGDRATASDVQIIWRADIDDDLIRGACVSPQVLDGLTERLAACPPASTEAMSVPISAARRWLRGESASPVSDMDGIDASVVSGRDGKENSPPQPGWVVWNSEQVTPQGFETERIHPGDILIVPTSHGGVSDGTWDPDSGDPVTDLAARALHEAQRVDVVRFHPALVELGGVKFPTGEDLDLATMRERRDLVASLLDAIKRRDTIPSEAIAALRNSPERCKVTWPFGRRWGDDQDASLIVWAPTPRDSGISVLGGAPADSEALEDASSLAGRAVRLADHQHGVGRWVQVIGGRLGLTDLIVDDLSLAGRLHDEGKRDPRFQLILHGGDKLAAAVDKTPLAKSSGQNPSAVQRMKIRERSGYPQNARHEFTSLSLVDDAVSQANDPNLTAHIIATHHGWGRPFAPPVLDTEPVTIPLGNADSVSSDHGLHAIDAPPPQRFWSLTEHYGWYGLAWLEAIFRTSDHRQSETETVGERR